MSNVNETNGSTEWVRTLEDRLCARPIQLFVVGGKSYSVNVLSASDGDQWVARMNKIHDGRQSAEVLNAIAQRYNIEEHVAAVRELEKPALDNDPSVNYPELFTKRVELWNNQKEIEGKLTEELTATRDTFKDELFDCVFSYDERINEDRDEIIAAGITDEQVIQASQRLWYSTDPTKVRQSLEREIATIHGLS